MRMLDEDRDQAVERLTVFLISPPVVSWTEATG